jgi:Large polyvalent protein-associated domain 7
MAEDLNIVAPEADRQTSKAGDVPERLRRRYFTEARGRGIGFYADARSEAAAFRDHGARLTTDRNDPHVVRDLVAIAEHRGWNAINVRGHTEFRREVWLRAEAAGLAVRGYRPTERDLQQVDSDRSHRGSGQRSPLDSQARMRIVEGVVKARIVEPAEQRRVLTAARARLAEWLERGASFSPMRSMPTRDRHRG